ncbi:MAG: hypothetical protein LBQ74_18140, partial [Prevotella sp.]|nr:hypothetical protein [Prevotella sp.]
MHFRSSVVSVYDALLELFNDLDWEDLARMTYEDIKSSSTISMNSIRKALKELVDIGLIDYRSKQGCRYIFIQLDIHFPDDIGYDNLAKLWTKSQKKYTKTSEPAETDSGTDITPTPTPSTAKPLKKALNTPLCDDPPPEVTSPDKAVPPDDGIKRNYEGLQERLRNIKCPPDLFKSVVVWSNYGQNGHKIWEILDKIRDDKGLKVPLDFLKSRMQKAIAEGYVARPVY